MLFDKTVKLLVEDYYYDKAFDMLYNNTEIVYNVSYKTGGNKIQNIGGISKTFNWDCEFVNNAIYSLQLQDKK